MPSRVGSNAFATGMSLYEVFPAAVYRFATLEKRLSGPDSVIPDARMDFYVPKATEQRDLIAYFKRQTTGIQELP
jgi:cytochrome c2